MIALLGAFSSAWTDEGTVGMALLFQSSGVQVGVLRFDPDGKRGPVPGAVGGVYPRGGKEMAFMPGDSKYGPPKFVEIEWMVATRKYADEWKVLSRRSDKYSKQWIDDANAINARAPHYAKRIDLTKIINPKLEAEVRANSQNTLLKLIITFNDGDVDIKARPYKWR
jgi:hypothetical protein